MVKLRIVFLVFGITQIFCMPTTEQDAIDDLIKRLGENNNASGLIKVSGMLVQSPTVSLDIWNLLRSSIQNEVEKQSAQALSSIRHASQASVTSYYPKSSLSLVKLGEKNYFFSRHQKMSWINAASFCRLYNMDLVSVETKEEDDLIVQHLQKLGLGGKVVVYTSGHKIGSSTYRWINGESLIYENWFPGQPQHYATEHCLVYWESTWHDYHCAQNESHFICEDTSIYG